ncbi:putative helix loop helix domain containing protein [Lyophyllum shimeji]|uniref:Helix loop helix domain containing protein n=1 Tax=Lyophyllum shimeji TaxID=47721 RepID=A0A9P3UQ51_LYOSH|nr:putative helix loop helix domain containing protein [Lyophyllum shimeji]
MALSPLQPPGSFADFESFATFDPSLSNLFPNPPPLPSSADLFSPDETLDLQSFLDNFGGLDWELTAPPEPVYNDYVPNPLAPYSNPHLNIAPEPSTSGHSRHNTRAAASRAAIHAPPPPADFRAGYNTRASSESRSTPSGSSSPNVKGDEDKTLSNGSTSRSKPLLSSPQKRLNHIMSEQKRRNAIRDGYAQLIALLAPAGSPHDIGMPTRAVYYSELWNIVSGSKKAETLSEKKSHASRRPLGFDIRDICILRLIFSAL